MAIKTIEALCASSTGTSRKQITFNDESGLIEQVSECVLPKEKIDFYYGDNCLLFAGMGDIHIHAREDVSAKNCYKEDFHSASRAALNGGLVHLADMPNNPIAPVDDESYLAKVRLAEAKSDVPILMYAGIGPKTRPLRFSVPYKVYMGPSVGDLYFSSNQALEEVLVHYQNQWVSFHCEDPEVLEKNSGEVDHFTKRPLKAELMATEFALYLIEKFHLKGKLCHYSAGAGLQAIKAAKAQGLNVTCEVTPQHLFFSEEMIRSMSAQDQIHFQMNPPIRTQENTDLLLQALRNNDIDFLATDHAPHSAQEKKEGMSGLPGLDTYASFVSWLLIEKKISPETIALVTAENPGRFFNQFLGSLSQQSEHFQKWGKGLGYLESGYSASFTVLNLTKPQTINADFLKTKALWSPFLGITFPGRLEAVFLCGRKKNIEL
ncbi:MAG: amidohydrolase family protein [Bacteriovorax sp.]|nr:amidohydrolase family protein [Bacteriovorax sp.]